MFKTLISPQVLMYDNNCTHKYIYTYSQCTSDIKSNYQSKVIPSKKLLIIAISKYGKLDCLTMVNISCSSSYVHRPYYDNILLDLPLYMIIPHNNAIEDAGVNLLAKVCVELF